MQARRFAVLALPALVLLAGCAGPAAPEVDAEGRYVVHMAASQFSPLTLTVPVNATVVWVNDEDVPHDVQGEGFSSGPAGGMPKGDSFAFRFTKPGTYPYRCTVHYMGGMAGSMVGTVVVQ